MTTAGAGFLDLDSVIVARELAVAAQEHLRSVGHRGCEGFALWAGVRRGSIFEVTETLIPAQQGLRSTDGVCVTVDADELFRINVYLYERRLSLVAQLHSHPGEAYHSETDDTFPIATTVGAFSLVVPDFAVNLFSLEACAVYRLIPDTGWAEVARSDVRRLIQIFD